MSPRLTRQLHSHPTLTTDRWYMHIRKGTDLVPLLPPRTRISRPGRLQVQSHLPSTKHSTSNPTSYSSVSGTRPWGRVQNRPSL
jgi:hypothetical protein